MTAAWIIWRTPEAVRQAWSNFRREVRQWVGLQELIVASEGQQEFGYRISEKVVGFTLEPWRWTCSPFCFVQHWKYLVSAKSQLSLVRLLDWIYGAN